MSAHTLIYLPENVSFALQAAEFHSLIGIWAFLLDMFVLFLNDYILQ